MLLIGRDQEDVLLSCCDDTCLNKNNCLCVTDIGTLLAGQGMSHNQLCVLCCRAMPINSYNNLEGDYPVDVLRDSENVGCFVRYKKSDYRLGGPNRILQLLPISTTEEWIRHVFNIKNVPEVTQPAPTAELLVCQNDDCKVNILSHIDLYGSVGSSLITYNLGRDLVECIKCNTPVERCKFTTVCHLDGDMRISICIFCHCFCFYNPFYSIQRCSYCDTTYRNEAILNKTVCNVCRRTLTPNRRSTLIFYNVQQDDGSLQKIYFCKTHRLKGSIHGSTVTKEQIKKRKKTHM